MHQILTNYNSKKLIRYIPHRCIGCLIVYSLGYFFRWDDIAFFAVGVPVIALLIALVLSTESPVFLVAQNKVKST